MQDQYVGDIGDFGKYGLLRTLTGMRDDDAPEDALRLGVAWYLFPDEDKPDGKFIDYLRNTSAKDKKLSECDPELYDELHKIAIEKKGREVEKVQQSGVLPGDTAYYAQSLSYEPGESQSSKELRREAWLMGVLKATAKAELVFVDPDNGIASERVSPWSKNGPKYVFMDDLNRFAKQDKSLVIYHHLGRRGKAPEQINGLAKRLQESLKLRHLPWSLWYHRGTARVYFIVPHKDHGAALKNRLKRFLQSHWCKQGHFERVT